MGNGIAESKLVARLDTKSATPASIILASFFDCPMIQIRPSNERGEGEYGWLNTRHTFSFDQYHEQQWRGFRSLRVINEDLIAPGGAFPMHSHRDMEIITYVLEGALAHKDDMGNGSIIHPDCLTEWRRWLSNHSPGCEILRLVTQPRRRGGA
jgi:hypothetical protein